MASPLAQAAKHSVAALRQTLDILPAAAYTCDANGLITYFNKRAQTVWGRAPLLDDPAERYCGSFRLLDAAGNAMDRAESWMALAIRDRREYAAQETLLERPDGTRATVLSYATPLLAPDGSVASAMNILVNISDRKHVEELLDSARKTRDFYRAALADCLREQLRPMHSIVRQLCAGVAEGSNAAEPLQELEMRLLQLHNLVDEMVDSPAARPETDSPARDLHKQEKAGRETPGSRLASSADPPLPRSSEDDGMRAVSGCAALDAVSAAVAAVTDSAADHARLARDKGPRAGKEVMSPAP
jgi:hypothetical protein